MQTTQIAPKSAAAFAGKPILAKTLAVVLFAVLTALAAQAKFPVPGSPVPVTLQTLVVVMAGMLLGPALGVASMIFYLGLGLAGYAVFAFGFGPATLVGPTSFTAGYLYGFVLAQPLVGWFAATKWKPWLRYSLAALSGHAVILACGATWMAMGDSIYGWLFPPVLAGVAPFLLGSLLKSGLAAALVRTIRPSR